MLIINSDINRALESAFLAAKSSINIIIYSASLPKKGAHAMYLNTWRSLEMAIKRGIKTRVIFEQWPAQNPQAIAQKLAYDHLVALGAKCRFAQKGVLMHPKSWQIDEKILIIGSHNSTQAGFTTTKNLSLMSQEILANEQYLAYFNHEFSQVNIVLSQGNESWQKGLSRLT